MDNKSSKTTWTLVIGIILAALILLVIFNFWKYVVGLAIGLPIGYYYGYTRGKSKR